MSVQNAGEIIREARLKAGLTQEQLSEGVCSPLSLSRIENGTAGVSPSTFQALMAHADASCEAFPIFANRNDFDCFYSLKRVGFYLDSWQLKEAYDELEKVEEKNWAENKYYYQEWLLMHCKLQFRSGMGNHLEIANHLESAIHISRPDIDFYNFRSLLLSLNEIELLILYAQESLYLNKLELCLAICTQISSYLENRQITFLEKDHLMAEYAVVYAKYLITTKEYAAALELTEKFRTKTIKNLDDTYLHELTFLSGIEYYYLNQINQAFLYFKTAFFSSHSIESCYATICRNYLAAILHLDLTKLLPPVQDIPLYSYVQKEIIDISSFSDGTYDLFSNDTLSINKLIHELRLEQNISQNILCTGLCSKSKLSKIENETLQAEIALTQSLLQRLGLCDTIFTFYGNACESNKENLRIRLSKTKYNYFSEIESYAEELLDNCSSKDTIFIQYACYRKACCITDPLEMHKSLWNVLLQTLPNFNLNTINSFRLTWQEFTILNNYCYTYSQTFPSKGTLLMYKLLEYYDFLQIDVLEKRRTFPISIYNLTLFLYQQHRFSELRDLKTYISDPSLKYSLYFIRTIHAHYCQALAELKDTASATIYAYYAYYNFHIYNLTRDAYKFKNDFETDYSITLI